VCGGAWVWADTEFIQGRTYHRWMGPVPAGTTVKIELGGPFSAPGWALRALVGGLAAGLALAAFRALRPPAGSARIPPGALDADLMLERIAQLDARYAGGEGETDPAEWSRYRAERAELRARLEALLAAQSGRA
jgi:hypothetical protein